MGYLGKTINRKYRILRVIGQGGKGTVYEAEHVALEKKFALKRILPELARDRNTLMRFKREAKAAARVVHEHIIQVTDVDEDKDGTPYIVMELLQGQSLSERILMEGKLPVTKIVDIMLQVLMALQETHRHGIVHRDLKPENIYLTRFAGQDDWVKILDFGLAKFNQGPEGVSLTRKGAVLGTPPYTAPEQLLKGSSIDGKTDLYACGVILYQCLTGAYPFQVQGSTLADLINAILKTQPSSPSSIEPSIPEALSGIIMKSLAKNKDDRFASAMDMAQALLPYGSGMVKLASRQENAEPALSFASNSSSSSIITRGISATQDTVSRKKFLTIVSILLSLFIAAGLIWYFIF